MIDYLSEANTLFEYTRDLRRDFHSNPELGFQEVRTAAIVARELNKLGLEVSTGIAETGVVAMIESDRPGPVVLLRFDMDALPIQEETGASYASQNPGVMHACGHDGHTAIGLAVAQILNNHRHEFTGSVKVVFQPAEEGLGGAERMVAEGVLDDPRPDLTLTLHLWNEKPVGWLGITSGPIMAASEAFIVRILGKGGHGASPHLTIDPIQAAAQVITALQSVVSRNVPPLKSAVLSVTSLQGGQATNVIPPYVDLKGTIRSYDPEIRSLVLERFRQIVTGITETMQCHADILVKRISPAVVNDTVITERVNTVAKQLMPESIIASDERTMGSEDMAFMMEKVPGSYFFVGSANVAKGLNAAHHHPKFDFDELVLPRAVALISAAAVDFLKV